MRLGLLSSSRARLKMRWVEDHPHQWAAEGGAWGRRRGLVVDAPLSVIEEEGGGQTRITLPTDSVQWTIKYLPCGTVINTAQYFIVNCTPKHGLR